MFKKIIDIMFWVSFLSTIMHFYVWTLVRDSDDSAFASEAINITFLSGAVAVVAFWLSKPNKPVSSDDDKNY